MRIRAFFNWITASLWVLTLLSTLIMASFAVRANWIDQLHQWVIDRLVADPEQHYALILERHTRNQDFDQTERELIELADRLVSVQKNDALDATKRTVLGQLVWINELKNDLDSALHWSQIWLDHDTFDINAQLAYAGLLMRLPTTAIEGEVIFKQLLNRFPELMSVSSAYARALAINQRLDESFALLLPFLPSTPRNPLVLKIGDMPPFNWKITAYQEGQQIANRFWTLFDLPDRWELVFQADRQVDRIDIHIDEFCLVTISSIAVVRAGRSEEIPLQSLLQQGFSWSKAGLRKGKFNWAKLTIRPVANRDYPLKLVFKTRIAAPDILLQLFSLEVADLLERQIMASRPELLTHYQQARQALASARGMEGA